MASIATSNNSSTTTVKEPHHDLTCPLFLHHSDGPGILLTSQPLDHTNYVTWSRNDEGCSLRQEQTTAHR